MKRQILILISVLVISCLSPRYGHGCGDESFSDVNGVATQVTCCAKELKSPEGCCHNSKRCCGCCDRCDHTTCGCAYGGCHCNERPTPPPAVPDFRLDRSIDGLFCVFPSTRWGTIGALTSGGKAHADSDLLMGRFHTTPLFLSILTIRC